VPGTLVTFDTASREGGTIREGSLIYTPPSGFTGEDRYTFFVLGSDGVTREVEVLVVVAQAEAPSDDPTEAPTESVELPVAEDAVDRALGDDVRITSVPRWDPSWLAIMTRTAVLLLVLALAWWLLLVVRIQDRLPRG
jgi:hypothetical protein